MRVLSRRAVGAVCSGALLGSVSVSAGPAIADEPGEDGATTFHADAAKAVEAMVTEARARGMKGVAAIALVTGGTTQGWVSEMRVVDSLIMGKANVLGVAYCKLAEMADTLKDSGSKARPTLNGELGYRGGAIRKISGGYVLAAFSGGKDTDDLAVANKGLDVLLRSMSAR